jgi:hypothetical protein
MPKSVLAKIEFLRDLPLYNNVKPYSFLRPPNVAVDTLGLLSNLHWESKRLEITNIRDLSDFSVETCGFEVLPHSSSLIPIHSPPDMEAYGREIEDLVRERLGAELVVCFDVKVLYT